MNIDHSLEQENCRGYMYVSSPSELLLFEDAGVGDKVVKPILDPPYLIVDHMLENIILSPWPGKLLEVEVLDGASDLEQAINAELNDSATYTRTYGVKILKELPLSSLFKANGEELVALADATLSLTLEQVIQLQQIPLGDNRELNNKAWREWSKAYTDGYADEEDWRLVLGVYGQTVVENSPVHRALTLISTNCKRRAKELEGERAFTIDEDGDKVLTTRWLVITEHFLHAALSYEWFGLLTQAEKEQLRKPIQQIK